MINRGKVPSIQEKTNMITFMKNGLGTGLIAEHSRISFCTAAGLLSGKALTGLAESILTAGQPIFADVAQLLEC